MPVGGSSFLHNPDGEMKFRKGVKRSEEFNPVGRRGSFSSRQNTYYEATVGLALKPFGYET
jgi:hypothetical protein